MGQDRIASRWRDGKDTAGRKGAAHEALRDSGPDGPRPQGRFRWWYPPPAKRRRSLRSVLYGSKGNEITERRGGLPDLRRAEPLQGGRPAAPRGHRKGRPGLPGPRTDRRTEDQDHVRLLYSHTDPRLPGRRGGNSRKVFGEPDRPTVMPLDPLTMDWLTRNDLFTTAFS